MSPSATTVGERAPRLASYWPWGWDSGSSRGVAGGCGEPSGGRGSGSPHQPSSVPARLAGDTYFFKGAHYWRFPKGSVKAEPDSPQPMGPRWLDCPAPSAGPRAPRPPRATLQPGPCNCQCEINQAAGRLSSASLLSVSLLLLLLPLLVGDITSR